MKKRILLSLFSVLLLFFITGCNQVETKNSDEEKTNRVFSEKDKEKAIKMVEDLNEQLEVFESEANRAISQKEIDIGDNEVFIEKLNAMSEKVVIKPFLEKFPGALISNRGDLKAIYSPESADDCTFGNCNYDSINVPTLDVGKEEWVIYSSEEFEVDELTLSNVDMIYSNEQGSESTYISFVKGESGELYFSFNPIINSLNFNLKEWDQEFASIKSDVPESEVKAEEEEFRKEVDEVLAKYPPLQ
ncbi:hypothetical protein MKY37_21805 [Psychrobacillus sp. FSL K6-2836]|uniref:hypothetical protein n=1 Tax=Psychrobacillus sp. FSL K6-2836 TaxID=2921548 RepID=UPI0030FC9D6A